MAGGALGAGLRHLVGEALLRQPGAGAALWRALLVVGVVGGLATFTSPMVECLVLTREQRSTAAVGYLAISLGGGLLPVWQGARVAQLLR